MCRDLIRVSQGFDDCQLLARVAQSHRGGSLALCLQYQQNLRAQNICFLLLISASQAHLQQMGNLRFEKAEPLLTLPSLSTTYDLN
jgi:hypothetical protein